MRLESFEQVPETIEAAALLIGGQIFTGKNHAEAQMSADDELGRNWLDEFSNDLRDGFITSKGRFVERDEAAQIAKNAQQISTYRDGDILDSNRITKK
jgi:hypothetical protein